ncbi:hypothetical protein CR51_27350 [Caballeronia megalochromosomata]|nr:hypothetical protein CR51_27350 [Caballeronia megalochromosomata]
MRTSLTIGVDSTLDELLSARLYVNELIALRENPPELKKTGPRPRSLKRLRLSKHLQNTLVASGLHSVDDVIKESVRTLMHIPGLGKRSVVELQHTLAEHGLALSEIDPDE